MSAPVQTEAPAREPILGPAAPEHVHDDFADAWAAANAAVAFCALRGWPVASVQVHRGGGPDLPGWTASLQMTADPDGFDAVEREAHTGMLRKLKVTASRWLGGDNDVVLYDTKVKGTRLWWTARPRGRA